jgi:hypothetical protein
MSVGGSIRAVARGDLMFRDVVECTRLDVMEAWVR